MNQVQENGFNYLDQVQETGFNYVDQKNYFSLLIDIGPSIDLEINKEN